MRMQFVEPKLFTKWVLVSNEYKLHTTCQYYVEYYCAVQSSKIDEATTSESIRIL